MGAISVQFSHLVVSDSLQSHGMQHARLHHQLLELAQTHVYRVSDAIQPSHPLSSPSPPAPNPSLQLVTTAMKLKDTYSLEGKL